MATPSRSGLSEAHRRVNRALLADLRDRKPAKLYDVLRSLVCNCGTDAPALTLATAETLSEGDGERALQPAVAVGHLELASSIHAALAGAPGAPEMERPLSMTLDLLAGDSLYALAFGALADDAADAGTVTEQYGVVSRTTTRITEGIALATDWNGDSLDPLETAVERSLGTLFGSSLELGVGAVDRDDLVETAALRSAGRDAAVATAYGRHEPLRECLADRDLLATASVRAKQREKGARETLQAAGGDARLVPVVSDVIQGDDLGCVRRDGR